MSDFINQYPYADFHELNLDWIIKTVKDLTSDMESFKAINSIKYLGNWSITEQYQAWSIVFNDGYNYLSLKAVPSGIDIRNDEYWLQIPLITIDDELDINSFDPVSNRTLTIKFNSIDEANSQIRELIDDLRSDLTDETGRIDSIADGLNQEIVSRISEDELLNERINSIEALPDGSTTADAELLDIRIGANGKTYSSAGDAVRGQVGDLEDVLDKFNCYDIFSGLLTKTTGTSGGITFTWSGDICTVEAGTATNYAANLLIPNVPLQTLPKYVIPGRSYYVKYKTTNTSVSLRFRFKDSNEDEISTIYKTSDSVITIPDGTVYWSVSLFVNINTVIASDVTVSDIHLLQVLSLQEVEESVFYTKFNYGTSIPSSSDLDNYNTPGNYYVATSGTAATILNAPVTNTTYRLLVFESTASNRLIQAAFINSSASSPKLAMRNKTGSGWTAWQVIPTMTTIDEVNNSSIKTTDLIVTSENYLDTFPNGSFNDAPINSIITISGNVPLTDAPLGNSHYGNSSHPTPGYIRGTLMTYRSYSKSDTPRSGLTQIMIGYAFPNSNPGNMASISIRNAIYSEGEIIWSKWSKFVENGYLHSSNMFLYAGYLNLTFDDLDDMPNNSIVQIDLNLNGSDADHTLGHHPAPGKSCVAMCYAYAYDTNHGKVQVVYTIDGLMYWRYGYYQDVNDYKWTDWVNTASNALVNKGVLANETDLNSVLTNSVYLLSAMPGAGYLHCPVTLGASYLTTKANGIVRFQTVEKLTGERYSRYSSDSGSTWSDWV